MGKLMASRYPLSGSNWIAAGIVESHGGKIGSRGLMNVSKADMHKECVEYSLNRGQVRHPWNRVTSAVARRTPEIASLRTSTYRILADFGIGGTPMTAPQTTE
ncbi:hypothetical protein U1Q18_007659 [Sarracenia purpurea var. burkii]